MRIVIFGASGSIGQGVLLQALDHPGVEQVVSVGRRTLAMDHPKLRQLEHGDFLDFSALADELRGLDACFWCLGTASAGVSEADYRRITVDFTVAAARVLRAQSPELCFCFVSGAGTDDTGKSRAMWARVKGEAENALRAMGFARLHLFRPGIVQSIRGASSRGRVASAIVAAVHPLVAAVGLGTTNSAIGDAMISVAMRGSDRVLDSRAINRLSEGA